MLPEIITIHCNKNEPGATDFFVFIRKNAEWASRLYLTSVPLPEMPRYLSVAPSLSSKTIRSMF